VEILRSNEATWRRPRYQPDLRTGRLPTGLMEESLPVASRSPSRGCLIFLIDAPRCDFQRIIRQRALQPLRLIPWRPHPNVALLIGRQDHWHCLGMNRRDHAVRLGCEKTVDEVRAGYRFRFGATVAPKFGPDASKDEQRSIIVERDRNNAINHIQPAQNAVNDCPKDRMVGSIGIAMARAEPRTFDADPVVTMPPQLQLIGLLSHRLKSVQYARWGISQQLRDVRGQRPWQGKPHKALVGG
jgi:hypothetical protein